MQTHYALVFVMATTDETGIQVTIDELGRHTMGKTLHADIASRSNCGLPPLPVSLIDIHVGRQLVRTRKPAIEAARVKNGDAFLNTEATKLAGSGCRGSCPCGVTVLMLFYCKRFGIHYYHNM